MGILFDLAQRDQRQGVLTAGDRLPADRPTQRSDACCVVAILRFTACCVVHGRFGIDEYDSAPVCPKGRG